MMAAQEGMMLSSTSSVDLCFKFYFVNRVFHMFILAQVEKISCKCKEYSLWNTSKVLKMEEKFSLAFLGHQSLLSTVCGKELTVV